MKVEDICQEFDKIFPQAVCELNYSSNFELLVAVILSAQCTDKRVNQVTKVLFEKANTPEKILKLGRENLEKEIFSCGFYRNKAKSIMNMSQDLIDRFEGQVPQSQKDLTSLAGVGNKTANVMTSVAFSGDAIAVDTHVLRISNRLGFVKTKNPDICERELKKIFPKEKWSKLHSQMVLFGRYVCKSQRPSCDECPFGQICEEKRN